MRHQRFWQGLCRKVADQLSQCCAKSIVGPVITYPVAVAVNPQASDIGVRPAVIVSPVVRHIGHPSGRNRTDIRWIFDVHVFFDFRQCPEDLWWLRGTVKFEPVSRFVRSSCISLNPVSLIAARHHGIRLASLVRSALFMLVT